MLRALLFFVVFFTFSSASAQLRKVHLGPSSFMNVQLQADPENEFEVSLNLYVPRGMEDEVPSLLNELKRAQEKLNDCGVSISLEQIISLEAKPEFLEYESVEFNGGQLSPHELALFSQVEPFSAGIILVDSLDWTIGADGIVGIGYAPYILSLPFFADQPEDMQRFLFERMSGHVVLSRHRGEWTLLHELGHALMNLRHEHRDTRNIMLPNSFARHPDPLFSRQQCAIGQRNSPWVSHVSQTGGWMRSFQLFTQRSGLKLSARAPSR